MDTLDGIAVGVCSDEDDGYVAHFAKPSGSLDPFAASLQINVHQDDIWQIFHCLQESVLCVCCYIASVETQRLHVYCQAHGEQIFIFDYQCATLRTLKVITGSTLVRIESYAVNAEMMRPSRCKPGHDKTGEFSDCVIRYLTCFS